MADIPDSSNLFGELHTELDHAAIVRLFEASGWKVHRLGHDESRLESNLGELVLEAEEPFLLHGAIVDVVHNVDAIASLLSKADVGHRLECYGSDHELLRIVASGASCS